MKLPLVIRNVQKYPAFRFDRGNVARVIAPINTKAARSALTQAPARRDIPLAHMTWKVRSRCLSEEMTNSTDLSLVQGRLRLEVTQDHCRRRIWADSHQVCLDD